MKTYLPKTLNVFCTFRCSFCEKVLTRRETLVRHVKDHKIAEIDKIVCKYCNKSFARKDNLKKHTAAFHGDELSCECFTLQNYHWKEFYYFSIFFCSIEDGDRGKTLVIPTYFDMNCDNCSFVFETYDEVRSHYLNVHNVDKGHIKCCNKRFRFKPEIRRHIEWHEGATKLR